MSREQCRVSQLGSANIFIYKYAIMKKKILFSNSFQYSGFSEYFFIFFAVKKNFMPLRIMMTANHDVILRYICFGGRPQ